MTDDGMDIEQMLESINTKPRLSTRLCMIQFPYPGIILESDLIFPKFSSASGIRPGVFFLNHFKLCAKFLG